MVKSEYLTAKETAQYLKTTTTTIRRLCANGELPAVKIGRRWFIDVSKIGVKSAR